MGRRAGPDGRTEREHLEYAAARGHTLAQERLRGPRLPEGGAWAWACFVELDRWRGAGGFGMPPLTLHDLAAYEARFDVRFDAETVELIKAIDHERLAASVPPPVKEPTK